MPTIIDGTAGITFPNSTVQASAGQVLQVVSSSATGQAATSSSTYVTTGFAATITPKFSNSKILVIINGNGYQDTQNRSASAAIFRGATNIFQQTYAFTVNGGASQGAVNCVYLDSPATTSATTYTLYFKTQGGATYLSGDNFSSTSVTLMEIAA
jgi:hypothetical protein